MEGERTMGAAEGGRRAGRGRSHRLLHLVALVTVVVATVVLGAAPAHADAFQDLLRSLRLAPATPQGATTTGAAPTCGGQTLAKAGTSEPWTCTLAQEFDGTALDPAVWTVQETAKSGFDQGGACFVDSPQNIRVAGGALQLTTRREAAPVTCASSTKSFTTQYTAATVMTFAKFTQTYGRFEIRAKMPATRVPGAQFAYWLWPQRYTYGYTWPASGEIDVMEWYSQYWNQGIPYLHYAQLTHDPNVTRYDCVLGDPSAWHTYTLEWGPGSIRILYDGKTCLLNTRWTPANTAMPGPFNHPFMIALTQTLGVGTNAVTPSTPLPATAQIDYVRVWK